MYNGMVIANLKHNDGDSMYPQTTAESREWWDPGVREDTEDHSGVADRTEFLSRLCRGPR